MKEQQKLLKLNTFHVCINSVGFRCPMSRCPSNVMYLQMNTLEEIK